ncbi:flagellar hook assembly protein FlgD [Alienimonas sp. DA493]|uniref:flagellar hook assembly protein FlgD n=1 Tax=Alienimonas sp. DA493 TaxID=3373605 RepID=UPI0037540E29
MNETAFPLIGATPTFTSDVKEADSGLSSLKAEDFMKLLIAQLQNQDPSEPVSNETLLDQIATMRSLQADVELEETLQNNAGAADLSTAASFLGKEVRGFNAGVEVTGTVTRAYLADGDAFVDVDGTQLPLGSVTEVA